MLVCQSVEVSVNYKEREKRKKQQKREEGGRERTEEGRGCSCVLGDG